MKMNVNKMEISFPTQLFIDGQFCNASQAKKLKTINPHDESVICEVRLISMMLVMCLLIDLVELLGGNKSEKY